jgi:hypothetical protein
MDLAREVHLQAVGGRSALDDAEPPWIESFAITAAFLGACSSSSQNGPAGAEARDASASSSGGLDASPSGTAEAGPASGGSDATASQHSAAAVSVAWTACAVTITDRSPRRTADPTRTWYRSTDCRGPRTRCNRTTSRSRRTCRRGLRTSSCTRRPVGLACRDCRSCSTEARLGRSSCPPHSGTRAS